MWAGEDARRVGLSERCTCLRVLGSAGRRILLGGAVRCCGAVGVGWCEEGKEFLVLMGTSGCVRAPLAQQACGICVGGREVVLYGRRRRFQLPNLKMGEPACFESMRVAWGLKIRGPCCVAMP